MAFLRSLRAAPLSWLAPACLLLVAACATDGPSTVTDVRPAALAVRALVPRTDAAAGPAAVRITVAYLRQSGAPMVLGSPQQFTLDQATQNVPVSVDVATCLADPTRAGTAGAPPAADECNVQLTLDFLLNGVAVDQQVLSNVGVKPGQTSTVSQPVALAQVTDVRIVTPNAAGTAGSVRLERGSSATFGVDIIDNAGQKVTGRSAAWSSSAPSVATVSDAGVVQTVATGSAVITAVAAGRSVSATVSVVPPARTISVTSSGVSGAGQVRSVPAGISCTVTNTTVTGTCAFTFPGDVLVALSALANDGSVLQSIAGDCTVTGQGACTVNDGTAPKVTVRFQALRSASVAFAGDGDGAVVASAAGSIDCRRTNGVVSGTCTDRYGDGASVRLTASPAAGSVFTGWTGDCSGTDACTLTMDAARTVTARFARLRTVTVAAAIGTGQGGIASAPAGIACTIAGGAATGSCVTTVPSGTVVTLTPTPDANSGFAGWTGACTNSAACVVTVDANVTVNASFVPLRTLSVSVGGSGLGEVGGVAGLRCGNGGTACTARVNEGSVVSLSATPAVGSVFSGWTGACSGTGGCNVAMSGARAVGANFDRLRRVSVTLSGQGSGVVSGGSINCTLASGVTSGTCSADAGAVTLTASPAAGSEFVGWSGSCSGSGACDVPAGGDANVTATFRPTSFTLDVTVQGQPGLVSVSSGGSCALTAAGSNTCRITVPPGQSVSLTASPASPLAQRFIGWSGDCSGTEGCTVVMDRNRAVTAQFEGRTVVLTVALSGAGGGSVSGGGLSCSLRAGQNSSTCLASVPAGVPITLDATPIALSKFDGWSGGCGGTGRCTITPTQSMTVAASFTPVASQLSLSGSGSGAVVIGGAGRCTITNGALSGTCTTSVPFGQSVTLTVDPSVGFPFIDWGGACSGTSLSCTVVGTGNPISVTARFQSP
jgi:hypothetical protein